MPTYTLGISRTYQVTIQVEDAQHAKRLVEDFLMETDYSTSVDRAEHKFAVDNIELLESDMFEQNND